MVPMIADMKRIGRVGPGSSKVRLIKIELRKESDKYIISNKAKTLRSVEQFKETYISNDLTSMQQSEAKRLRDRLRIEKIKPENLNKKVTIKNGKIMVDGDILDAILRKIFKRV